MLISTMPPRFVFFSDAEDPERTLLVDGTAAGFRSLSHWPGNSTPKPLKRDLSTQIALAYARLPASERDALVGKFDTVSNNHYDTDGVLSCFAVLHPELALAHEAMLVDAAATGDFCVWRGRTALALDLSIMAISSHAASPVTALVGADASDQERWAASYAHWLRELPALLDDPRRHTDLIADDERAILEQLVQIADPALCTVERFPSEDLAIVRTRLPLLPLPLHEACGDLHRVLVIHEAVDGPRYRFCFRDESWFELVDKRPLPLPRMPLEALRDELTAREPARADASWWCEALMRPVTRLGFGRAGAPGGFFLDLDLADEAPSGLAPELVVSLFREALRAD